jgi:YD repeat-containing protein
VNRSNGRETLYTYDGEHRMTSMAVVRQSGEQPVTVFTNEYDTQGRVIRQNLVDGSVYTAEYTMDAHNNRSSAKIKVTEPSGRVLEVTRPSYNSYIVRTTPIRFPAVR